VTGVDRGSPASRAGIVPSVVIVQIDRQPVRTVADFKKLAREHGKGLVRLRILRGDQMDIVALEP
jgi:S1-C subfamily serine protease